MAESGAKVLIADDNRVNRLLLARNVELLGHSARLAENGRIALEMLQADRFDLLLLDMEMPEMDGFEVLETMRRHPELRDLPVIVTSSLEGIAHVARCIELGAEDYLSKPVNPIILKARVNSSLEKKRLRDQQKALVRRFATAEVAADLQESGFELGGRRVVATVMFCDLRGFTSMCEVQTPEETIDLLNVFYTLMFDAISEQGGVINQIIGDGLMAVFGAPVALPDPPLAAARTALEMHAMIDLLNAERTALGKAPIGIGVGIATGEVIAGYTGTQTRATYTCIGDTVNLASRLEAHTRSAGCDVLMDEETCRALDARLPTTALGPVLLKGKAQTVEIFALPITHAF